MANTETNWIFNLIDHITAPMRNITRATAQQAEAVEDVQERVKLSEKDTREALANEQAHRKQVTEKIKEQEKAVKELEKAADKAAPGRRQAEAVQELSKAKVKLEELRETLKGTDDDIKQLTDDLGEFQQKAARWDQVATGINQFTELVDKVASSLDFAEEIQKTQTNIQRMTGLTGSALEDVMGDVHRLGKVFGDSDEDIAIAANAMTKQMGGSFEENLALIKQGYEKGANLNGDMLDQLKEYSSQASEFGISTSQALALMAQAGKDGVFSDKALDSLKEANLSLKEMGQPQVDALAGIGLLPEDLKGKTTMQAVQMISEAMQQANVTVQQKQLVMADIFKGAGEDAGMQWIEGLAQNKANLEDMVSVEETGAGFNAFVADMQMMISNAFGKGATYITNFATAITGLSSLFGVMTTIKGLLTAQTVATEGAAASQRGLNLAMINNPVGWVVAGIAVLVGGIVLAWNKFEGFRKVVFGLWEAFKQVFNNIAGLFKAVFAPVMEAITAVREGRYMDAAKAVVKLTPVGMAASAAKYAAGGGLTKGVGEAWEKGKAQGAASWAKDQEKKDESIHQTAFNRNAPVLDGLVTPDDKKKGKKGDGLNIDGSGGGKAITMNLEIKNYFNNVSSQLDVRRVADQVASVINDRLRDAAIDL